MSFNVSNMEVAYRLQEGMEQLDGFLELFLISNYLHHHQLPQYPWGLETTFHLLLVG